jgi:hypothetical protein
MCETCDGGSSNDCLSCKTLQKRVIDGKICKCVDGKLKYL